MAERIRRARQLRLEREEPAAENTYRLMANNATGFGCDVTGRSHHLLRLPVDTNGVDSPSLLRISRFVVSRP